MRNFLFHFFFWFKRRRGIGLRLLLCWLIGLFVLSNDEISGHDQRLQVRGDLPKNSDIAVVILKPSDLKFVFDSKTRTLMTLGEVTDITDGFYWEQKLWRSLLAKILKQKPRAIGVTLYFGENIGSVVLTEDDKKFFLDPLIFWSSTVNSLDRPLLPLFSNDTATNVGSHELKRDDDGVVRRVTQQNSKLPHLAEKLAGKKFDWCGHQFWRTADNPLGGHESSRNSWPCGGQPLGKSLDKKMAAFRVCFVSSWIHNSSCLHHHELPAECCFGFLPRLGSFGFRPLDLGF
ncbi:MAG: CHASE2 domain-containing protein [Bdellovibrionales bacterium]|nr:CHASE2 domain-containing protein [Bdellovibrionales bacterium]